MSLREYREQLLDHLDTVGFVGMKEFLYGTLSSLRQKLQREEEEGESVIV